MQNELFQNFKCFQDSVWTETSICVVFIDFLIISIQQSKKERTGTEIAKIIKLPCKNEKELQWEELVGIFRDETSFRLVRSFSNPVR